MSEQKLVNPKGNWFQRFAKEWGKTNMLQKMGLQHDPNQKHFGINPLMANPITAGIGITSWALQKANRDHTGTDTVVEDGILKAKDRPGNLMRGITGTADFVGDLTGQSWDFDRQGQWFGNQGKAEEGKIGSLAPNYEIIGGQVQAKKNTQLKPGENEGGELMSESDIEDEEREDFDKWQEKLKETEAAGNRLADRNLIRRNIAALPSLMAAGNLGVADAARHHSEQTVKAMAHIPQLQLASMSYQPMINYSLGR